MCDCLIFKKIKNVLVFFYSKGQGVISAFSKGQGVTKKGQGAAPCKRSLGRTLVYVLLWYRIPDTNNASNGNGSLVLNQYLVTFCGFALQLG